MAAHLTENILKKAGSALICELTPATEQKTDTAETFSFLSNGRPYILIAETAAGGDVTLFLAKDDAGEQKKVFLGRVPGGGATVFLAEPFAANEERMIKISALPAPGKDLKGGHAFKLAVIQI
jgi:hypothetical protein